MMSDTPKFEVIDRRKFKAAEEEQESQKGEGAAGESAEAWPTPEARSLFGWTTVGCER